MAGVVEFFRICIGILALYVAAFYRLFISPSKRNVRGQVVVVTGGGQGIGREIARQFARLGTKVVIWDYDQEKAENTAAEINNTNGEAKAYKCDVTDIEAVNRTAIATRRDVGEVDILVNNAGILNCKDILSLSEKEIRRTMEVNILAHFWTVKAFLSSMMERRYGHIITIASMAAKGGRGNLTDYCASKFAADGFTQALFEEMKYQGQTNIKTTTVFPMFVHTNLVKNVEDRMKINTGVTEWQTAEEVAKATVDGCLRGQRYVYVPSFLSSTDFMKGILPIGAEDIIQKYTPVGFFEKS